MNRRQRNGSYPIHNSTFAIPLGLLYRINGGVEGEEKNEESTDNSINSAASALHFLY